MRTIEEIKTDIEDCKACTKGKPICHGDCQICDCIYESNLGHYEYELLQAFEKENVGLKKFYDYWTELYGTGLEVLNWHLNGDTKPFDNFFDNAEQELNT